MSGSDPALWVVLAQCAVPNVTSSSDISVQVDKIERVMGKVKGFYPQCDLIVFPEYSTQGLNAKIWTREDMLLSLDGPEVKRYQSACRDNKLWGVFSVIERNPKGAPYNTAIIINDQGELVLTYRKLQPWVPREPWAPGLGGMPVCTGPKGSKLSVCICHDGMFPELAREAAYKGCNVYIRISGYTTVYNQQVNLTNRANAWQNLMYTVAANLAGPGPTCYHMGESMIVDYEGTILKQGGSNADELVLGAIYPMRADKARLEWGLENNIFNLGYRGYVGKPGGETANYLTWVKDLAEGNYHLPWEDSIKIR